MKNETSKTAVTLSGSVLMTAFIISPAYVAHAQESQDRGSSASTLRLEEVVVTARKREENLQDAGFSVSALGSADLDRRPDYDLSSFSNAAPNVIITDMQEGPGGAASMSIRGIGTSDHERSIDPTVGVVVDGVFIGTVAGALLKAIDIERVEILRGPQGTLFGRNTIGGAIILDRKKPEDTFGAKLRGGFGNYNALSFDGYVNLPVSDTLAVKVGGAISERDGYARNVFLNRRQGDEESKSANISALWAPSEDVEVYYRFEKQWIDQDAAVMHNMATPDQIWCSFYNQCAVSTSKPQSGDLFKSVQDDPGFDAFFDSDLHIFTVNWQLSDEYSVDYLFGRYETDEDSQWDYDGTPLTLFHTNRPTVYDQDSHELRLGYDSGRLTFTAGLYLFESSYRIDNLSTIGFGDLLFGLPSGTILTTLQIVEQTTDSYAAFFEGDYDITEKLSLTLGARYTEDEKTQGVDDPLFPELAGAGGLANPVSEDWEEVTSKIGLRYRVSDDLMLYGLYSRGYRSGGFTGRPGTYEAVITPYDPELVDNYEIGFKSQWFNDRMRLNTSIYYMEYKDKQEELSVPVDTIGGTGQQTLFVNASTAELQGIEIELTAQVSDRFSIKGMVGYLDAEYTDFDDPVSGESIAYLNLRRAPDLNFTISPTYVFPVGPGELTVSADWHFVSEYDHTFWNSESAKTDDANLIDAQVSYDIGNTTFSMYGRNLADDDSHSIGLDVGRSATSPGLWTFVATRPPRTYGISVTHRF